jgi:mRNA turnover protein 4
MEPQLRALGLHTSLVRGVPSLTTPHQLCRADETLTSEQCRILKLLGVQMAVSNFILSTFLISNPQEFRILLGSRWSKDGGFVQRDPDAAQNMDED